MEHPPESLAPRTSHEKRLRPRVVIAFGATETLEPGTDQFLVTYALRQLDHLRQILPADMDTYERSRNGRGAREGLKTEEIEHAFVYEIFRQFGITPGHIRELADAARADAAAAGAPGAKESKEHRFNVLERLIRDERSAGHELASFGAVTAQAQHAAEGVTSYVLKNGISTDVRHQFGVRFYGPVEAFILASRDTRSDVPEMPSRIGCYDVENDIISVPVDAQTLDRGWLSEDAVQTLYHEMVHAVSPGTTSRALTPSGFHTLRKTRTGFFSESSGILRRRSQTLIPLNEGTTELMAQSAFESQHPHIRWHDGVYESYKQDVTALCALANLTKEEFFTLYLSKEGVLQLSRIIRERTALGPHGLSLFDIFSQERVGGFVRFLDTMRLFHAGLPYEPIMLHETDLQRREPDARGDVKIKLKYPPLSSDIIELSFPFVQVEYIDDESRTDNAA
jgi:hypothetical protein